jgi:hypothetical protein
MSTASCEEKSLPSCLCIQRLALEFEKVLGAPPEEVANFAVAALPADTSIKVFEP